MRAPFLAAAGVCLAAGVLAAQPAAGLSQDTGTTLIMAPAPPSRESVRHQLDRVRLELEGRRLPRHGDISWGSRRVAAGQSVPGPLVIAGGQLDIFGLVRGDAIALGGDVVIHPGGHVSGDAVSAGGRVRVEGGSLDGERLVLTPGALSGRATEALAPTGSVKEAMALSLGWLVMMLLIGIGVLVFARPYLDGVVTEIERDFTRSLWVGLAGQLAIVPLLVVLAFALILTVIGILLVPFAVVAFVLAVVGIATLGYLAAAQVFGTALTRSPPGLSDRGQALRSLVVGVAALLGMWIIAAALGWVPVAGWALRGLAFAVTWVAATAGFGAAILSRAGTRRPDDVGSPSAPVEPRLDPMAWQTPTPVTGVAAARRPTPVVPRS